MQAPLSEMVRRAMAAEQSGKFDQAEAYYRAVPKRDGGFLLAQFRLGVIAARAGRSEDAVARFEMVLARQPANLEALNWMAGMSRQAGRISEGAEYCRRGIAAKPNDAQLLFGLGQCHLDQWRLDEAIDSFLKVVAVDPKAGLAWNRLGLAYIRRGSFDKAQEALRAALKLTPSDPAHYVLLAQNMRLSGRSSEAEPLLDQAKSLVTESPVGLVTLANALIESEDFEAAEAAVAAAMSLKPDEYPTALYAHLLQRRGAFAEARCVLESGLLTNPHSARLGFDFAYCGPVSQADTPIIHKLEASVSRPSRTSEELDRLHYALGKAYNDLGDFKRAFSHFEAANAEALRRIPRSLNDCRRLESTVDHLIDIFSPKLFEETRDVGSSSTVPIFIFGMLRSGTTLVEQILSAHEDVSAAGEVSYLADHASSILVDRAFHSELAPAIIAGYLQRLAFGRAHTKRVTDKMPSNLFYAGLAHILFPNSKLIRCRRDPLDNCLSLFVTPFDAPQAYLHSPELVAFFYHQHERITEHWAQVIPASSLLTVNYEELVADKDVQVGRLLKFLDLPESRACLSHHESSSGVDTPSRWQVRQPISAMGVGRSKNYPWFRARIESELAMLANGPTS